MSDRRPLLESSGAPLLHPHHHTSLSSGSSSTWMSSIAHAKSSSTGTGTDDEEPSGSVFVSITPPTGQRLLRTTPNHSPSLPQRTLDDNKYAKSDSPSSTQRGLAASNPFSHLLSLITPRVGLAIIGILLLCLLLHFAVMLYVMDHVRAGNTNLAHDPNEVTTIRIIEQLSVSPNSLDASNAGLSQVDGERTTTTTFLASEIAPITEQQQPQKHRVIAKLLTDEPVTITAPILIRDESVTAPPTYAPVESHPTLVTEDTAAEYTAYAQWISSGQSIPPNVLEPFSIVYCWVNGSDNAFREARRTYDIENSYLKDMTRLPSLESSEKVHLARKPPAWPQRADYLQRMRALPDDSNRFREFDELKYSVRSIWKHAKPENINLQRVMILAHDCLNRRRGSTEADEANCYAKASLEGGTVGAADWDRLDSRNGGDMQVPAWLKREGTDEAAKGRTIELLPHSKLWYPQGSANPADGSGPTLLPPSVALPSFSSFSIESRLMNLRHVPNLSRRLIYANDDMMFGADLHTSHFWTPQYGIVIYAEDGVVKPRLPHGRDEMSLRPTAEHGKGEWAALEHTNTVLGRRFGERGRAYVSHFAHALDTDILHEMSLDQIIGPEAVRTSTHRFRGLAYDLHTTWLFSQYIIERSREVMLRSYIAGRLDANHDGYLDPYERQDFIIMLNAYDAAHSKIPKSSASQDQPCPLVSNRDTLNHDVPSDHTGTKYIWSSLDGFPYARRESIDSNNKKSYSPIGTDSPVSGTTPTRFTANDPMNKRHCKFVVDVCFGPQWVDEISLVTENVLYSLTHTDLYCGDCLLTMMIHQSGEHGVEALLPPVETSTVNECHDNILSHKADGSPGLNPYRVLDNPFYGAIDTSNLQVSVPYSPSYQVDLRPLCPSDRTFNWREAGIRAIRRYQYVVASGTGMFVRLGGMFSVAERDSLIRRIEKQPTFMCVNDDGLKQANDANLAGTNFRFIMNRFFPNQCPWER